MNWIKHPLELRHLGVLSGVSKMISKPTVCLAQTVHLSCTNTNTISIWTKTRFDMTHVTLEFHQVRPKHFLMLWYIWHKLCTYLASRLALSLNGLNRASTWDSSPGVTSGASKMISEPMVHSAQTVHQSCVKIITITKQTQSSIHLSFRHLRVPLGAAKMISEHLVHSAQTMHLSCVKISTISNELGQASTWASSPRSTIGCVQNDFWPYGMFSTNHAPILNRHQHYLQMDQNKIPHDPHLLGVPSGASKLIYEVGVRSAQTMHLLAWRLALSSNRLNRASTWASSPNSTTRCVQNDFWAYSMFVPSYAPILH
jgi:hypothetical protein